MSTLDESNSQPPHGGVDPDEIIAALDAAGRKLPVEAIRAARAQRDAMVSKLIAVIQEATAAVRAGKRRKGDAHFFALFLLTEFQAREAWPAILEAISLPGKGSFDLFGDAVTSFLSRTLVTMIGDRLEALDELVRNRELNEYVRWAAAEAFTVLMRYGRLTRVEAVERLRHHLREAIANEDHAMANGLVNELAPLLPREAYDDIVEAYGRGLVDEFLIGLEDVDRYIAEGEAGFRRWLARCRPTANDTVAELEGWACFQPEPPPRPVPKASFLAQEPPTTPKRALADRPFAKPTDVPAAPARHIGRNDPCPCGSGKKFKKCCGGRRG